MKATPELRLAQEQTNRALVQEVGAVLRAPLVQALGIWLVVEYLCEGQGRFAGSMARAGGSALEVAAFTRMFDLEKVVGDIAKVSEAYGKVGTSALSALPMLVK